MNFYSRSSPFIFIDKYFFCTIHLLVFQPSFKIHLIFLSGQNIEISIEKEFILTNSNKLLINKIIYLTDSFSIWEQ